MLKYALLTIMAGGSLITTSCATRQAPLSADKQAASKRADLSGLSERMAKLIFIYDADQVPAEFIRSHPVVVGNFFGTGETETHWLGAIHHPRENSNETDYYVALDVKVKKTPKFKPVRGTYRILLLKPSVDSDIGKPGNVYTVVGYSTDEQSGRSDGVVKLYQELRFTDKPTLTSFLNSHLGVNLTQQPFGAVLTADFPQFDEADGRAKHLPKNELRFTERRTPDKDTTRMVTYVFRDNILTAIDVSNLGSNSCAKIAALKPI